MDTYIDRNKYSPENLDRDVMFLGKALRQKESNDGRNTVSKLSKQEGSIGALQYLPATFNTQAKKLGGKDLNGNPLNINDDSHQNLVWYTWAKELKDKGYGVDQIAAAHNGGEGRLTTFKSVKGTNKYGNDYDLEKYANDAVARYRAIKQANTQPQSVATETIPQESVIQETPTEMLGKENTVLSNVFGGLVNTGEKLTGTGLGFGSLALKGLTKVTKPIRKITDKIAGTDTSDTETRLLQGMEQTQAFAKKGRIENTGGKIGDVVGTVAPYLATAGAVNPITANLPTAARIGTRALADTGVALAQTDGNIKAGAGTFASSAVTDALLGSKGKALKTGLDYIKQAGKATSAGYASDVAMGLSGQRGEDRTGGKAFIPGAGTALGGAIGTVSGITGYKGDKNIQATKIINKNKKDIEKVIDNNVTLRKLVDRYSENGVDVPKIVSQTDLLQDTIDSNGKFDTRASIEKLNDFIRPQEKVVSDNLAREGRIVNLKDVAAKMEDDIKKGSLMGGNKKKALDAVKNEIEGLMLDADVNGNISVSKLHDAKIDKYSTINYENPASAKTDKIIAKSLKELVESNTDDISVRELNKELQQHFATLKFLEKLNGKKVEGGRLGKYFAQSVGAVVGSHFGPLGAIAGSEIGSAGKGYLMQNKFKKSAGEGLNQSEAMQSAIKQSKLPPKDKTISPEFRLPAGRKDFIYGKPIKLTARLPDEGMAPSKMSPNKFLPTQSSNITGALKNTQSKTIANTTKPGIPTSLSEPRQIVNRHLESSLQAIGDVDTFDMIEADKLSFFRQQLDDISMSLKKDGYKPLADSISSIDVKKLNSFEDMATAVRDRLKSKGLQKHNK